MLLRPDRGCLTFSLRMRAVWRHDVFITRVIRHKNGIDTLDTLRTSRSSGDAVLTNEKLPHVASRGREVGFGVRLGVKDLSPTRLHHPLSYITLNSSPTRRVRAVKVSWEVDCAGAAPRHMHSGQAAMHSGQAAMAALRLPCTRMH